MKKTGLLLYTMIVWLIACNNEPKTNAVENTPKERKIRCYKE